MAKCARHLNTQQIVSETRLTKSGNCSKKGEAENMRYGNASQENAGNTEYGKPRLYKHVTIYKRVLVWCC